MPKFCVNKNPQSSGEHEVHNLDTCNNLPDKKNQHDLGTFATCRGAVRKAKEEGFNNVDGCFHCCPECHTR